MIKLIVIARARKTFPRFWEKVNFHGTVMSGMDTECWEWTAGAVRGYGYFWLAGKTLKAHRVAYELLVGAIDAETLDHLCKNASCVNPDHLEPVSLKVNVLRGNGPAAQNATKTHCVHGHPLSGANLYLLPSGGRSCRECARKSGRHYDRHVRRRPKPVRYLG